MTNYLTITVVYCTTSLSTIKASHVVVLNEDSVDVINENSCKQHDPHPQIEFDFVEKQIHKKWSSLSTTHILMYMYICINYVSQRSQI